VSGAEWIEIAVAVATAVLALITWRMAAATKEMATATQEMARGSESQLELLRRQAAALETAAIHSERRLQADTLPRLSLGRLRGESPDVIVDQNGGLAIYLRNDGGVTATVSEARINLAPDRLFFDQEADGSIGPGEAVSFRATIPGQALPEVLAGRVVLPISVNYRGPRGEPQNMQVEIRAVGGGESWTIFQAERHKP
jgi:hypothetical protein